MHGHRFALQGDAVGCRLEIEIEVCGGGELDDLAAAHSYLLLGCLHGWMVGTPDVAEVGEVSSLRFGKYAAVVGV